MSANDNIRVWTLTSAPGSGGFATVGLAAPGPQVAYVVDSFTCEAVTASAGVDFLAALVLSDGVAITNLELAQLFFWDTPSTGGQDSSSGSGLGIVCTPGQAIALDLGTGGQTGVIPILTVQGYVL